MDEHEQEARRAPDGSADSTGDLLRRLARDVATLAQVYGGVIRDHYQGLARDAVRAALLIGSALALAFFALGLLVATLVLVVAIWVPGWIAALAVLGVLVLVIALLVIRGVRGVRRRRAVWAARVEEEVRWLRSLFPRQS